MFLNKKAQLDGERNVGDNCMGNLENRNNVIINNGLINDIELFHLAQLNVWTWIKYCTKRV